MIHKKIDVPVHYDSKLNSNQKPFIETYFMENYEALEPGRLRPVVLICPGGGYDHLSVREGEAVAIKMNSLGFHSAILHYSLDPMEFPAALCDLAEAVNILRKHSSEYHIANDKIIVCGFSAGGHLASSLGCYWNSKILSEFIPYKPEEIKPNTLLLCYPVVTSDQQFCHKGSIVKVLGKNRQAERDLVSIEQHVSNDFPPSFIWHTNADETVPTENSLLLANALRKAKVDFEYHIFSRGKHGLGLATKETSKPDGSTIEKECAIWPELFSNWYFSI